MHLDGLVNCLLNDVALCGDQGADHGDVKRYAEAYYRQLSLRSPQSACVDQTLDDAFVHRIWTWLERHPDIEVRPGPALTEPTAETADQHSDESPTTRLHATAERMWHAVAGHAPDPDRIPRLDFTCLSIIASRRDEGICQPDLVRISGQDKRSVPARTQRLCDRGYIIKRPVVASKARTSLLILRKFAEQHQSDHAPTAATQSAPECTNAGDGVAPLPYSQGRFYECRDLIRSAVKLIEENEIIIWDDLKNKLNIRQSARASKILAEAARALEARGYLQRVRAPHVGGGRTTKMHRCIRSVRPIPETEWEAFLALPAFRVSQVSRINASPAEDLDDEDMDFQDTAIAHENLALPISDSSAEQVGMVAAWSPDRQLPHILHSIVVASAMHGISTLALKHRVLGDFFSKPYEVLLTSLVDDWPQSQPLHLRYLAMVRDAAQAGRTGFYMHYAFPFFVHRVADGLASGEIFTGVHFDRAVAQERPDFPELYAEEFFRPGYACTYDEIVSSEVTNGTTSNSQHEQGVEASANGRAPRKTKRKASGSVAPRGRPRKHPRTLPSDADLDSEEARKILHSIKRAEEYRRKKLRQSQAEETRPEVGDADGKSSAAFASADTELDSLPLDHQRPAKKTPITKAQRDKVERAGNVIEQLTDGTVISPEREEDGSPTAKRQKFSHTGERSTNEYQSPRLFSHISESTELEDRASQSYRSELQSIPRPIKTVHLGEPIRRRVSGRRGVPPWSRLLTIRYSAGVDAPAASRPQPEAMDMEQNSESRTSRASIETPQSIAAPTPPAYLALGIIAPERPRLTPSRRDSPPMQRERLTSLKTSRDEHQRTPGTLAKAQDRPASTDGDRPPSHARGPALQVLGNNIRTQVVSDPTVKQNATLPMKPLMSKAARVRLTPFGGSTAAAKKKVILDLVHQSGGLLPGDRQLWYPFTAKWTSDPSKVQPEPRTVRRLQKELVESGKLRQFTFNVGDAVKGVVTRSILIEPGRTEPDTALDDLKHCMIQAHPEFYWPNLIADLPGLERLLPSKDSRRNPTFHVSELTEQVEPVTWRFTDRPERKGKGAKAQLEKEDATDEASSEEELVAAKALLQPGESVFKCSDYSHGFLTQDGVQPSTQMSMGEQAVWQALEKPTAAASIPPAQVSVSRLAPAPPHVDRMLLHQEATDRDGLMDWTVDRQLIDPALRSLDARKDPIYGSFRITTDISGSPRQHQDDAPSFRRAQTLRAVKPSHLREDAQKKGFHQFALQNSPDRQYLHRQTNGTVAADQAKGAEQVSPTQGRVTRTPFTTQVPPLRNAVQKAPAPAEAQSPQEHARTKAKRGRAPPPPDPSPRTPSRVREEAQNAISRPSTKSSKRKPKADDSRRLTVLSDLQMEHMPPASKETRTRTRARNVGAVAQFSPQDDYELCLAVLCVRDLAGGIDRGIEWAYVLKMLGSKRDQRALKRRWDELRARSQGTIAQLRDCFRKQYLLAYKQGDLPPMDFGALDDYDWQGLYKWAKTHVRIHSKARKSLPKSFEDFRKSYPLQRTNFLKSKATVPRTSVDKAAPSSPSALGISRQAADRKGMHETVANWIRTCVVSHSTSTSMESAQKRLSSFPQSLVSAALVELIDARVIETSITGMIINGAKYDICEAFPGVLRQPLDKAKLCQAAAYKHLIDGMLSKKSKIMIPAQPSDGHALAICNLAAAGQISFEQSDLPLGQFGLSDGNYRSRHTDKEIWTFGIEIKATKTFTHGNPLTPLPTIPGPDRSTFHENVPDATSILHPVWIDTHGQVLQDLWERIVMAAVYQLAAQPGADPWRLTELLSPCLLSRDTQILTQWLVDAKVAGSSPHGKGLKLTEWWWMVFDETLTSIS